MDLSPPTTQTGLGFAFQHAFQQAQDEQKSWAQYTIHLLKILFSNESVSNEFGDSWILYHAGDDKHAVFTSWMNERIRRLESIVQRLPLFALSAAEAKPGSVAVEKKESRDIFIVHGQDTAAKEEVARFIEKLGLRAIILHEQSNKGRTIIEKFEQHAQVGFAVVLLTPDDVGHANLESASPKPRARQNVVFELGFFIGALGRSRVCALLKGSIEIPTDISGVLYTPMDPVGAWRLQVAREIKEGGIDIDLNKAL